MKRLTIRTTTAALALQAALPSLGWPQANEVKVALIAPSRGRGRGRGI
jgi:hypothetical protein